MSAELFDSLPELVLLLKRDGSVISQFGGHGVMALKRQFIDGSGWSEQPAALIKQLIRRSLTQRGAVEGTVQEQGHDYDIRITPQGPDRVVCTIRTVLQGAEHSDTIASEDRAPAEFERLRFLQRARHSLSLAVLRERPIAIAVMHIDGLSDVAHGIGGYVDQRIMRALLARLKQLAEKDTASQTPWYFGQLGEHLLGIVVNSGERDVIEALLTEVCISIKTPFSEAGVEFRLTPHAGVEISSNNSTSVKQLLEHARAAAIETKRHAKSAISFYSDTMQLRAVSRLDMARELREAIDHRQLSFRYVPRHDLATGELVAWTGYLRWHHPLRGHVRPADFLRVAQTTGLGVELSRAALRTFCESVANSCSRWPANVRVSFGALRDHLFHEEFVRDVDNVLAEYTIPPERFELRVPEKVFVTCDIRAFQSLQQRNIQLVVDEMARGVTSIPLLAKSPVWGLQLDRAWVTAVRENKIAERVCRASIASAAALQIASIATGIDDESQRLALLELGCRFGCGDLYRQRFGA